MYVYVLYVVLCYMYCNSLYLNSKKMFSYFRKYSYSNEFVIPLNRILLLNINV